MKILVIKFRHIGDVLLTTPFVKNLRLHYPDAQIDIAINSDCEAIYKYNRDIDNIFLYPRGDIKKSNLLARAIKEWRFLKRVIASDYDIVFNLTEGDRGAIYSLLSQAKSRVGIESKNTLIRRLKPYTHSLPFPLKRHTVEKNLTLLSPLNIPIEDKRVYMTHSSEDEQKIDRVLRDKKVEQFIHIHPVSRWLFKCWSSEGFAEVIDYIQEIYSIPVIITAAPDAKERERVEKIISLCNKKPIDLSGELTLNELSALIKRAKLFIGVDTAPMHMAAAHDIPVIALFGPTDPQSWGPWENSIAKSCWEDIYTTQRCGIHTVIRREKGEILMTDEGKISTGMMRIESEDLISEIERYLGVKDE